MALGFETLDLKSCKFKVCELTVRIVFVAARPAEREPEIRVRGARARWCLMFKPGGWIFDVEILMLKARDVEILKLQPGGDIVRRDRGGSPRKSRPGILCGADSCHVDGPQACRKAPDGETLSCANRVLKSRSGSVSRDGCRGG